MKGVWLKGNSSPETPRWALGAGKRGGAELEQRAAPGDLLLPQLPPAGSSSVGGPSAGRSWGKSVRGRARGSVVKNRTWLLCPCPQKKKGETCFWSLTSVPFIGPSFPHLPFPYNLATIFISSCLWFKLKQMFPFPVANNYVSLLLYMFPSFSNGPSALCLWKTLSCHEGQTISW